MIFRYASVTLCSQFLTRKNEVHQSLLVVEAAIRSLDLSDPDISLRDRAGILIEWVVNVILPIGLWVYTAAYLNSL